VFESALLFMPIATWYDYAGGCLAK
jgi:hypothetical protein